MKPKEKKGKFVPSVQLIIVDEEKVKLGGVSVTMTITNTVHNGKTNTKTKESKSNGKATIKFKGQAVDEIVLLHMDDMTHDGYEYTSNKNVKVEGCKVFTDDCPTMTTSL